MLVRSVLARTLLAALGLAAACSRETQESYSIEIVGAGDDLFAGATKVYLEVNGQKATETMVVGKAPVSLSIPSLDPRLTPAASFGIRAVDAADKVVAYGETPVLELLYLSTSVRVFVQPPATLAHGQDADEPHSEHFAVATPSIPLSPFTLSVPLPIFGTGKTRLNSTTTTGEVFSPELYLYNPLTHFTEDLGTVVALTTLENRTGVAGASRDDGYVFVFGGRLEPDPGAPPLPAKLSSQLDAFRIGRDGVSAFFREAAPAINSPAAARSNTVMVATADPVFALGGLDENGQPLATIARMNVDSAGTPSLGLIVDPTSKKPITMLAPRSGHTATLMAPNNSALTILVFGGAPAGGPVAELFDPKTQAAVKIDAQPASPRRNHAAVLLPGDDRVLLIGGSDGTKPLDDGLLYSAKTNTFQEHVLKLQTARENFTAFVINKDIVVFGGRGANGQLLGDGEIFDAETFAAVGTLQSQPRAGASATVLTNESVILIGGEVDDLIKQGAAIPTNRIDIYQPRR